jgi:hypothetical protein
VLLQGLVEVAVAVLLRLHVPLLVGAAVLLLLLLLLKMMQPLLVVLKPQMVWARVLAGMLLAVATNLREMPQP